jgi:aminoglycoside phosphotransferase (APT) family kinase protein
MELSPATQAPGFPSRAELVERYGERSGRPVGSLGWYEALANWKAAVFCEALYGRYLRGERDDPWAAALDEGVPRLLSFAQEAAAQA